MLADQQAHIRRRAALGVGRARIADAVEPLSAMLATEPDPEVRQMAAFALGMIGNAGGGDGADGPRSRRRNRCCRGAPPRRSASSATRRPRPPSRR